jgi:lysophospholipase L1-like esterase
MPPSRAVPSRLTRVARRPAAWAAAVLALALAACGGTPASPPAGTGAGRTAATATPTAPVLYVAIGASDAVGIGADDPNTHGYVPLLIAHLPPGSRALNLGISGTTLDAALGDELPEAVAAHPRLVTVWLAGNDFRDCVPLQGYGADLDTLLATLQTQTGAHVFVANLPDMSLLPSFQDGAPGAGACFAGLDDAQIHAMVLQWDDVIDAAVARHGDVLVDLFNAGLASHPEYVYVDGFHPSTQGYAALAALFWSAIQAHGGVPAA